MVKNVRKNDSGGHALVMTFGITMLVLLLAGGAVAMTPVNSCGTISSPGVYILNQSIMISAGKACINIASGNIILDGNGYTITGSGKGSGVYLVDITGVTIKNLNIRNFHYGIHLKDSRSNSIINNTASLNDNGIYLEDSKDNNISKNTLNTNNNGIYLEDSKNDAITNNIISLNNLNGIYLKDSKSNIYNNFFNNTNNFRIIDSVNKWNITKTAGINIIGGLYLGGNVWANPNGTGFSQTCTDSNSDGICDSSYTLTSKNMNYLLPKREEEDKEDLAYKNIDYLPLAYRLFIPAKTPPEIIGFAPSSPVSDIVGAPRSFNITVNQVANVTWYINGTQVLNQSEVTQSSYINISAAQGIWVVKAMAANANGTASHEWIWNVTQSSGSQLPPDPSTVAPPIDTSVATDIATATEFLYTGSNPIQTKVANGTIDARRVAVLRGRVLTREGANLSGVNITILSHPEFGRTMSRADGMFDMAVNGGGLLTVNYEKAGYLTVQRQVNAPWRDYAWLLDVVMIQADTNVTAIDLSSSTLIQVARGSVVNDSDGTRKATLFFSRGTKANMMLPNGTIQNLTTLHVRATEYTVGASGPNAMPAELPPNSGYTYAVELSVDEAPGANVIRFNQSIPFYLENFLNFSVGTTVPLGYYNRSLGEWIASDNGLVIRLLNITGGMANIDIDGSNQSASASRLAALNITDAERQQLAALYQPNQSLWRMPINHFSPWDANWGIRCKNDRCVFPNNTPPYKPYVDCQDVQTGSIIGCQNQVLGEAVSITGTPFSLRYQSDRVPGRNADNSLRIPLSGPVVLPELKFIILKISVAGRQFYKIFPPSPNLKYTFVWDGKDASNRTLQGPQPVKIEIGYAYDSEYKYTDRFGYNGNGLITSDGAREGMVLWQKLYSQDSQIGRWDGRGQVLGGWSLNVHHAYDPFDRVLYMGNGEKRSAQAIGQVITTVAGGGSNFGDGGPATQAVLYNPQGVAVGQDGSIYIAESYNARIRRVGTNGNITTVAGNGSSCYNSTASCGDGGPATQAQLSYPYGVAVGQDGSIYIADRGNRIRRVGTDGNITTVAGNGSSCYNSTASCGDGGPATQAQLSHPYGVAVGQDGSIYIADSDDNRIRRVGTDGIITTIAGNGTLGNGGDGGPATQAQLIFPTGVAIGHDGSIYIAEYNVKRRVGTDGIITTVLAGGESAQPYAYITNLYSSTVAVVDTSKNNVIATIPIGGYPSGVAVAPDGTMVYVGNNNALQVINTANNAVTTLPVSFSNGDVRVAVSPDGAKAYVESRKTNGIVQVIDTATNNVIAKVPVGNQPMGIVVSPDGKKVYVANTVSSNVSVIDTTSNTVIDSVQIGTCVFGGDGCPEELAINPAGTRLYVTSAANGGQHKVSVIDTSNDSVIATVTGFIWPQGIAVTPDGTKVYVGGGSSYNNIVSVINTTTNTIKTTVPVGAGSQGVSVTPDGRKVYVALNSNSVAVINTSTDTVTAYVPVSNYGCSWGNCGGDPKAFGQFIGPTAPFRSTSGVAVGRDGSIYISDKYNNRIRRVGTDGAITTVAGSGCSVSCGGYIGDGGLATQAQLSHPYGVAVGHDGSIYIADSDDNRIRRVAFTSAEFSNGNIMVSSEDGSEIYVFNSEGRHLQTLDALTGAVRYNFTYDSVGRLTTVRDGDGNVVTIEYDSSGNVNAIISPYGQRTSLTLDANGYLASITNPAGESNQFSYTYDGLLINMTDPRGYVHNFSYDSLGRLIRDEEPDGGFKTLSRTDITNGYYVTLATGLNRNTTYQVEQLSTGDQRRVNTQPDGLKITTIIGTNGSTTNTYPDGTRTNLQQGPDPRFGMLAPVSTNLAITTPGGLTQTVANQRTAVLANPGESMSLQTLTETVNINGRTFTSTFDASTKTITSTTPFGRTDVTILNNKSRIVQGQVPGIVPVNFTYDARGRPSTISQGTRTYSFSYDAQGNLANITDPLSRTAGFEYDSAGRVTRQILPDGRQIQYAYDAGGNVIAITPPGRPSHAFNYTPVDLIKNYTPPDVGIGDTSTRYTYNIDRQLTNVTRPDGVKIDLGYNSAGRLSTVNYPQGITTMSYDAATGNLKDITAPDGGKITYGYDGSLLTDTNWSGSVSGSVHRTYDNNFSITSESVNGANTVNFQYDMEGLLTQAGSLNLSRDPRNGMLNGSTLGNNTDTIGYSSFGEEASYQAAYNGTGIFSVNYTRDAIGRIVQKNETIVGATHTYAYMYDRAGRLTNVSKDGVIVSQYTYDANGNRLSYTNPGGTISGSYDNQDRLLQYGTTTYTYTANGELLSKTNGSQTTTYQYDALGNLRNVTLPDGRQIEYIIDGQNRRIGKKVNGVLVQGFLWESQLRIAAELDGSGNMLSRFVYGTRVNVPDIIIKGRQTYRVITDRLGSPKLVVNIADGSIAQRIDYDEWGDILADTNPGFQPFGFAGGLYDRDLKMVRFGARDYDPETGRWTQAEPLMKSPRIVAAYAMAGIPVNPYAYAANNPLQYTDKNGKSPLLLGGIVVLGAGAGIHYWIGLNDAHYAEAAVEGLPGFHNGMGDALKHCIWSCEMSQDLGKPIAQFFGWAHEFIGNLWGQPIDEYKMDTYNNKCGRDLSDRNTDCKWNCLNAYDEGQLQRVP